MEGVLCLKKRKKEYIYNCPAAFDIETTSFYRQTEDGPDKAAIMYLWQFGLNGNVMIGRTWEEFATLCDRLTEKLQLQAGVRHLCVYVHNLGFEFAFLAHRFKWAEVFSISLRRPIYATTTTGLCFRCSLLLSGYSLDMVGRNLLKYKVRKLSGDLDYSLMRNCDTVLTPQELQYGINDVLVVMAYIMEKIEQDRGITRLQLTKTGYVRKLVRDACLYPGGVHDSKQNKMAGRQYERYHLKISHLRLEPDEYRQAKRAFQGGFTHANGYAAGRVYNGVDSYDFTSSYPAVMIAEQFPMTEGEEYDPETYDNFLRQLRLYNCMFDVELTNLESTFPWDHYLSYSRCVECVNPSLDNGRLIRADRVLLTLTELDFDILQKTYTWDDMTLYSFRRYRKNYLPKEFVTTILDLYQDKTQLKGLTSEDGSVERRYLNSKENLNSLYGMCVMDICRPQIVFDGSWSMQAPDVADVIEKYNNSRNRFNSYLWGVWVTAYARHNLWTAILELGPDYLYADTDSVKVVNGDAHREYFDLYNAEIVRKLDAACRYHNIDPERTRPCNSKGKQKQLGVWDYEGRYTAFKTLGAKRYLTQDEKGVHLTVAGLGKATAAEYLMREYGTPEAVFQAFADDLDIPAEYEYEGQTVSATGKNTHTYIDEPYEGRMTDYQGHTVYYRELSGIHMEPAAYSLSLAEEYVRYLFDIRDVTTA